MPHGAMRLSRDEHSDTAHDGSQMATHPVAITQMIESQVRALEDQFRELDLELRRRFGDQSYSVDRSEQVLGAIQRLRWAIARSPLVNPFPAPTVSGEVAESD